jgi:hypothetical protein
MWGFFDGLEMEIIGVWETMLKEEKLSVLIYEWSLLPTDISVSQSPTAN